MTLSASTGDGPYGLWLFLCAAAALATAAICTALLRRYAHPTTSRTYLCAVWLSWFLGFAGVFLLPIDICIVVATGLEPPATMYDAWMWVYWLTFILAWVVDPIMQSYHDDGGWHVKDRLRGALRANVKFYVITVAIIVGVIIAVAIFRGGLQGLPLYDIVIGIANAYGLLLVVFMLGYGMVALPRGLWYRADSAGMLESTYFLAPDAWAAAQDAQYDLRTLVTAVNNAANRVLSENDAVLIDFIHLIQSHIPPGVESNDQQVEFLIEINMHTLSQLHAKLLAASAQFEATAGEWERICDDVEHYRIIIEGTPPVSTHMSCYDRWYWKWRFSGRASQTLKSVAVFTSALSLIMFWCLITIPGPDSIMFSPWGAIVVNTSGGLGTFLFSFVPLSFMSMCTFLSLFQFNWCRQAKLTVRRTDASGLLFNAYYLCRLQFCIGFNYLLTLDWPISDDPDAYIRLPQTAFHKVVGSMGGEATGGIVWNFLRFMPLLIGLFAASTLFNVHAKILNCIGVDAYARPHKGNAEHDDRIVEGKDLVDRELRRGRSGSGRFAGIESLGYRAPRRSFIGQATSQSGDKKNGEYSGLVDVDFKANS